MSVKNDLTQIKNEFNKDGQILESAFRFEILLRRYRKSLIALLVLIVAGAVYMGVSSYLTQQRHTKANAAFREITKAQTPELLETLKQIAQRSMIFISTRTIPARRHSKT